MEDFGLVFPLSFQQVYKDVDGGRGFGVGRWGSRGRGISFGSTDDLRARIFVIFALGGVVARESAIKTSFFMDALGFFGGGE